MKKKKNYEQPEMTVTHVELENPICAGSPDMNATSPNGATITSQQINPDFSNDNSYGKSEIGGTDSWDQ